VEYLNDEDFQRLGITTIGDRLKVEQACRNSLKGKTIPLNANIK